ncbi:hypothetical protein PQX77_008436 [Marasmius sp. AFHP31]|nr:hypothetical protein PQX77_008436 [Marasmius sp. AFHP31]
METSWHRRGLHAISCLHQCISDHSLHVDTFLDATKSSQFKIPFEGDSTNKPIPSPSHFRMSVLTSNILGSIKFVGKTRTHFYKAVEVVKTCRELELTIEPRGTLSLKAYSTIHKAAENSLSRVVKDANNHNLFRSFVNSVERNVDWNRWLQFEEKWKAAESKDVVKERLHKWASERISHAESRKKVELWVSYFTSDEPVGPIFASGPHQPEKTTAQGTPESLFDTIRLHWLFMHGRICQNTKIALYTGSHFYQNLEKRVSSLRDGAIDGSPFAADGTWKPSTPLDFPAITAISSGERIDGLGSAPLFLLWNRSGEVPLYINTPASQCYRNMWDLGTAVYLLKEQGTGTLVLSTSFIKQFRNSEITAYHGNGTTESWHSNQSDPRTYWNDLFKRMHNSPGNWTLVGPPAPCGPSSMPEPEPPRRNPQHGSPTTTPPSQLAEFVLGDSSLAQRPTMPVPAEPRQRPQQAVPLVQHTPSTSWASTEEPSSSSGNTRPPTTSSSPLIMPSPPISTPAKTIATRDVASASPSEFDLGGSPDTSVQSVTYPGQLQTSPSSSRVMSGSVNSEAQGPTMPMTAKPRQRPQQVVPLVPVQPTPLPGWVPTEEPSSSSGNTRPPTTSIASPLVIPSPQIPTPAMTVAERDVASAPPSEFDLDGSPDNSVQPVMYLGQPRTPRSSLRVMSRSVNSEAQGPTMPMPAEPQQRPWQAAPVSTPLVQPTPLQSSAPARPVSTKRSSSPVNNRLPNISFPSPPAAPSPRTITPDTIVAERNVTSAPLSNRDQPAPAAPQNVKKLGIIQRFKNFFRGA